MNAVRAHPLLVGPYCIPFQPLWCKYDSFEVYYLWSNIDHLLYRSHQTIPSMLLSHYLLWQRIIGFHIRMVQSRLCTFGATLKFSMYSYLCDWALVTTCNGHKTSTNYNIAASLIFPVLKYQSYVWLMKLILLKMYNVMNFLNYKN